MNGIPSPPPPPARKNRRPFITAFIGQVFQFLPARDLLQCGLVSRAWREESVSMALWRQLLMTNSETAPFAFRGLALKEMQRLALSESFSEYPSPAFTLYDPRSATGEPFPRFGCNFGRAALIMQSSQNVGNTSQDMPNVAATFTSSDPQAPERTECCTPLSCRANCIQNSFNTLKLYSLQLMRQIRTYEECVRRLLQNAPNVEASKLYERCSKELKQVKLFEEIVTSSFCQSEDGNLGMGLRSFVQIEIISMKAVGSSHHLSWCRFKKAFPLDNTYYDYLDVLHSCGQIVCETLKYHQSEIERVESKLKIFHIIKETIGEVISARLSSGKNVPWKDLIRLLETRRCNE
ncbi:hypothetical protein TRVL_00576 [Trypanosoma vivax]|uniref:F-box domain-containing protein n=1 Tax=Trypanosoma vivax (strain Y486) TaxID=1055687 RepID=G0U072_TRYVY|nr:hypothetical protein TRVL_00576 [Trypanosoma vivax]CCC49470.1 conserved hypothetical protein [Trypanosoma vivax Y486]